MHLTETFAVKLLQTVVSDVSPKKVPAHILLIKLTKIINYSRLNVTKNAHLSPCCDMLRWHVAIVWPRLDSSSLKLVKFEPTTLNMWQHIATRWPNAHNMLRPTMFVLTCCECCNRLAGALRPHWTLYLFCPLKGGPRSLSPFGLLLRFLPRSPRV